MRIRTRTVRLVVLFSGVLLMPPASQSSEVEEAVEAKTSQYVDVDAANEKTLRRLREASEVDAFEEPLTDVLDRLAQRHDVQYYLDVKAIDEAALPEAAANTITLNLSGISLGTTLGIVLRPCQLSYTVREGLLFISTIEELEQHLFARVYPVHDMLHADHPLESLDELTEVISTTIDPNSWSSVGGAGMIAQYQGSLVISQTCENHQQIKELFRHLRKALKEAGGPNLPVRPMSRVAHAGGTGGTGMGGFGGGGGMGGMGGGGFFDVANESRDRPFPAKKIIAP